jgi:hypothetical protein
MAIPSNPESFENLWSGDDPALSARPRWSGPLCLENTECSIDEGSDVGDERPYNGAGDCRFYRQLFRGRVGAPGAESG